MLLLEQDKPVREMEMDRVAKDPDKVSKDSIISAYERGERDFHGCNLDHLDFTNCHLSGCDFSEASLVGTIFQGADLTSVNFCKADLTDATLSRALLTDSDLCWAKLSNATLVGAELRHVKARATNFSNALIIRSKFNDADCLGANFSHVNATAAQFESANLECTDFSHAVMMNANLCGANCSWVNFYEARLNWANLSWSLLEAADMEETNLTGAILRAANLSFSNLDGAILTGSDLYFANLAGALVPEDASKAARVSSARLTSQTYTRSKWTQELLKSWQQRGAIIQDFSELPKDVQAFIKQSGICNLRIYFSLMIDSEYQLALETLIYLVLGQESQLRILSIATERNRSQVAFFTSNDEDIDTYISCLKNRTWQSRSDEILKHFEGMKYPGQAGKFDIIHALTVLSEHIVQIQALVPLKDEQMRKLQSQVSPVVDEVEAKTQISWSSVSLACVKR